MKLKMYSVYDTKAEAYGTPFFMGSRGMAIRAFSDLVNDPKSFVFKHPSDYILFECGEFDDSNGGVSNNVPPLNLGLASVWKVETSPKFDVPVLLKNGDSEIKAEVK